MRWGKLDRSKQVQPRSGSYSDWKPQVAATCAHRCVYCGIHESRYGGLDNFHVDHFRPQSLNQFKKIKNDIGNLYLACAICNRFKSNDWPNDPVADHSIAAYPDPCECTYAELFREIRGTYRVEGLHVATRYVIERLGLNRAQLIVDRRTDAVMARWEKLQATLASVELALRAAGDDRLLGQLLEISAAQRTAVKWLKQVYEARPYAAGETQKVAAAKGARQANRRSGDGSRSSR